MSHICCSYTSVWTFPLVHLNIEEFTGELENRLRTESNRIIDRLADASRVSNKA